MPKEIITELATEIEGGGTAQFSIHWGSGAGGEIHLGVTLDRASLAEYMAGLDDSETTVQWYSRPLRRPQVQRLIRAARRARDAVFGADE